MVISKVTVTLPFDFQTLKPIGVFYTIRGLSFKFEDPWSNGTVLLSRGDRSHF